MSEAADKGFEALLDYVKASRGFDFGSYKRASLERRVQRRMQMLGMQDYATYRDYLEVENSEFTLLFNTILINVTCFFRDDATWEYLAENIIPKILESKNPYDPIRVWSAGCASGEEPYSLAMLFAEALGTEQFISRVKIYATDLDEEALTVARHATYTPKGVEGIPPEMLAKYFERTPDGYVFNKELRRSVIFGRHDLLQDAPISKVDLLVCRNTLMYFNAEAQGRILDRFHFALNELGYLFLGKAEMLLLRTDTFQPIDLKRRIFAKKYRGNMRERLLMMAHAGAGSGNGDQPYGNGIYTRIQEVSFQQDPLAQIIVDIGGTLVLANERARHVFKITEQDIGKPLQDLEVSYRPVELRSRMELAAKQRSAVIVKDVELINPAGDTTFMDVHVGPLIEADGTVLGVRFAFTDTTRYRLLQDELEHSKQELETAYEELQSANEELTTTNEELQSTVEELETTNEELQSTNEELETMNEELQSTNEELETMNREMRDRTEELKHANRFMESILRSLNAGVVVVDKEMKILAWNSRAEDLWGMRRDEVLGKHLLNLDIGLPVDELRQPIRRCAIGEQEMETSVVAARNRRGKPIQCQVRCMPLLPSTDDAKDGGIWGVIVLMDEVDGHVAEVPAEAK